MTQVKKWFQDLGYAFKIADSKCKAHVCRYIIAKVFSNVLRFVFDVYFISYLLKILTSRPGWNQVIQVCLIGVACVVMRIFFDNISEYAEFMMGIEISPRMKEELYRKSMHFQLDCYKNKEFYDRYSMVLKNGSRYVQQSVVIVADLISVLFYCAFFITGFFTLDIAIIGVVVLLLGYHFFVFSLQHKKFAEKLYEHEQIQQPFVRKNDYFKRIFYLKSFAYDLKDKKTYEYLMEDYDRNEKTREEVTAHCKRKEFIWNVLVNGYGNLYSSLIVVALLVIVMKWRGLGDISVYWQAYALFTKFYGLYFFRMGGELTTLSKHISQLRTFQETHTGNIGEDRITGAPDLRVENLSFRYDTRSSFALSDINLTINRGEKVAIVGRNGSGKTTLFNLLLGVLQPEQGEILIDGKSVKEYNFMGENNNLGLLCQNYNLYSIDIKDNISMGDGTYRLEQVKEAASRAQCDEFLENLPSGLETFLGRDIYEDAVELSGGQGQRVALARVFLKQAPLVFMDEPTAYIDPVFEKGIIQNFMESMNGKTTIMITHRLEATKYFDRIIVMDDGKIVEEGSFRELMSKKTLFSDMYRYQTRLG